MYRFFYWAVLRHLPAEATHNVAFALLRAWMALPGMKALCRRLLLPRGHAVQAMGLTFASPLIMAAGFDKNATGYRALLALGFGGVEVGTVTAQAQAGNPKPRLFRLHRDHALLNRMGFNNQGAAAAAARLRGPRAGIVGVNIGKTKVVDEANAPADYAASARAVANVADYLVINVSSPNTPGLRALQGTTALRGIIVAVRATLAEVRPSHLPLLVKIAPDLADEDVDAIADLALELGLDGLIATNTTISREGLCTDAATVAALGAGGISGAPVAERSLAVLRRLRARVGDRLTLIAAGGITAENANERLAAGAHLLQIYTEFIYRGPLTARRLVNSL